MHPLTPAQQLDHFLYKPQVMSGPGVITSYSSMWLALFDARVTAGRDRENGTVRNADPPTKWLGAIGYLVLMDQLGKAVKRPSMCAGSEIALLRTLEMFSALTERERKVVYALRCALAHDYSLVNVGKAGNHLFTLQWDVTTPLVQFPAKDWDGAYANAAAASETVVNLFGITKLGEDVISEVFVCNANGDLELGVPVDEAEHRYFVKIN